MDTRNPNGMEQGGSPQGGQPANPLMTPAPAAPAPGLEVPQMPAVQAAADDKPVSDDPVWIEKAKLVIQRSKGDPFTRHDAMNKLKIQYLQQRFGKTIGD